MKCKCGAEIRNLPEYFEALALPNVVCHRCITVKTPAEVAAEYGKKLINPYQPTGGKKKASTIKR